MAKTLLELDIKPEIEIMNESFMREVHVLINKALIKKPYWLNFVFGMKPQGCIDAAPKNLFRMIDILPLDALFSVGAVGGGQLPLTTLSIILGGHVRVGMEDNIYYTKGVLAKNNAQFVERVVRIARELGREIATPKEARGILQVNSR